MWFLWIGCMLYWYERHMAGHCVGHNVQMSLLLEWIKCLNILLCVVVVVMMNWFAAYFQIILALGNYMNSGKRGAVYGFKLQSLDLVRPVLPPSRLVSAALFGSYSPSGHFGSELNAGIQTQGFRTEMEPKWPPQGQYEWVYEPNSPLFDLIVFYLLSAAGHQVDGPQADTVALHRRRSEGEVPAGVAVLQRAELRREGCGRWAHDPELIFYMPYSTPGLFCEQFLSPSRGESHEHVLECVY